MDIKFTPHKDILLLAAACSDGDITIYRPKDIFTTDSWTLEDFSFHANFPVVSIAWSQCIYEPPMLAIGCADRSNSKPPESYLQIWIEVDNKFINSKEVPEKHYCKSITDVAWAPFIGRAFHMLATTSEDKNLSLWKVKTKIKEDGKWSSLKVEFLCKETFITIVFL